MNTIDNQKNLKCQFQNISDTLQILEEPWKNHKLQNVVANDAVDVFCSPSVEDDGSGVSSYCKIFCFTGSEQCSHEYEQVRETTETPGDT